MFGRIARIALIAASLSGAAMADASAWRGDRFNMVVREQNLRDVLTQFGALAGVPVVMTDAVDGTVSARFEAASGEEVIAAIAREYALDWRFDGRRIEVSANSEQVSRILDMGGVRQNALTAALDALGAYEPRFPIKSVDGQLALVVGPPRYVGIVEIVLAELVEAEQARSARAAESDRKAREIAAQERERLAELERIRLEEELRLRALLAARPEPVVQPKPVERQTPLVNRGGRWGG